MPDSDKYSRKKNQKERKIENVSGVRIMVD